MRLLIPLFLLFAINGYSQKIEHRLIIFGDAGEINAGQHHLIKKAIELIIPSQTSAYFLGDNIYPTGMGLNSMNKAEEIKILQSQYEGFISNGVPVTFIPGNHDWDKSGKDGLAKVRVQEEFINGQGNSNLKYLPKAGTSDLHIEKISSDVVGILYDSEYWLFPHHANPDSALNGTLRKSFLDNLQRQINSNKDKTILVFSHHPMESYGEHGVNFSWKDHIFPLTRKWKNAYLPLPIIGSIYPLIRTKILSSPEDTRHPVYHNLIQDIKSSTSSHKNVIFVAGHDHGLQYIVNKNSTQIVTGSGSKSSHIAHHPSQKYVSNLQGFCVLDCLDNKQIQLTFYTVENQKVIKSFESALPYNK